MARIKSTRQAAIIRAGIEDARDFWEYDGHHWRSAVEFFNGKRLRDRAAILAFQKVYRRDHD